MKQFKIIYIILSIFSFSNAIAQTTIGDTANPNASAVLQLKNFTTPDPQTTRGFIPPKMTTAQITALGNTVPNNTMIFNTTKDCLQLFNNVTNEWRCIDELRLDKPSITSLNCASVVPSPNSIADNILYYGKVSIPYIGGNGISYDGSVVGIPSTGVSGLTAYLVPGTLATGAGNLEYIVTGTPTSGGTASFAISFEGISCTLNLTVNTPTITSLTCASATFDYNFAKNKNYAGVLTISYPSSNGMSFNEGVEINSTGVLGLKAKLLAGTLKVGGGKLYYLITGKPTSVGTVSFNFNNILASGSNCNITAPVGEYIFISNLCDSQAQIIINTPGNNTARYEDDFISATPCGSVAGASANDDGATTGTEYDWTGGTNYMSSNTRNLIDINGQCWFRYNAISNSTIPARVPNWPVGNLTGYGTNVQWGNQPAPGTDQGYYGYYNTTTPNGTAGWQATEPTLGEGKLYQWSAAMNTDTTGFSYIQNQNLSRAQGICPSGWHIPSDCEWLFLEHSLGLTIYGNVAAAGALEASGERGRDADLGTGLGIKAKLTSGNLTSSGFNAIYTGSRRWNATSFASRTNAATFWSSSVANNTTNLAVSRSIVTGATTGITRTTTSISTMDLAYSVRCLKD